MIKGSVHVGMSVADLDRSVKFYREAFGMEVIVQEPFEGAQYDRIMALTGVRGRVALVQAGSLQLELFEFSTPRSAPAHPDRPVSDHGITHFCVEVDDLDKEYRRLLAAGVRFHCEPLAFSATERATYARDPDGNVFELLETTAQPVTERGIDR